MPISRPFKGASYHLNFFYPRMFFVFLLGFFSLSWLICRKNRKKYWPVLNTRLVSNLHSQIGGSLTEQPDKSLIIIILRFSILFLFVNLSFHLNFDLFLFFSYFILLYFVKRLSPIYKSSWNVGAIRDGKTCKYACTKGTQEFAWLCCVSRETSNKIDVLL